MPELQRSLVGRRLPPLRERPATGHLPHGRVDLLIMRAHLRAQEAGALPTRRPACQRHKSRPCFRHQRPGTFLAAPE